MTDRFKISVFVALSTFFVFGSGFTKLPQKIHELNVPKTKQYNDPCFIRNTTFQHGEELCYKVYYNVNFVWVPAGELTMQVEDIGNQFHLRAVGSTYRSYDWFYTVRDYYDSYLDKNSLLPVISIRNISEGKYKLYDKVVLNQGMGKATAYRGNQELYTKRSDFNLSGCMHDIFSILYYCRNISFNSLNTGTNIPVKILLDEKEYPLNVQYLGKQSKTVVKDMGTFKTIRFSPQIIDGRVFKDGSELKLWVSDDLNKIPLLIESPLSVGSVKVVLKSFKGLRHPFTAKVE